MNCVKFVLRLCTCAVLLFPLGAVAAEKPVSVTDTINATLRNHRALKTIQENRDVIVHELRRAKAGWGPRVEASGRMGVSQMSNTTTRPLNADNGFYAASNIGVTLIQPIWDGFATRSRVRTAESTLDSMTNRVFDNATTLGLDGLIAHIDVLRQREILRLTELHVDRHREILASAQERQQLGADTMADVTQTQARLSRALSTLADAKKALREGEEAYRRVTGSPVPDALIPVDLPPKLYEGPDKVFEVAKESNPKLLAYLDDIKAARGEQELTRAQYHPVINLEIGPNYTDRSGPGDQWTNSFEIMGTMRWNLFNSGADVAAERAATSRVRMSRQSMYNFVDDLAQQVKDTWTSYIAAKEQFEHYTDAIGFNTATRDAYIDQFVAGQRSLLDVLDAESELYNSSTQAVTAHNNIVVATYRLQALAGVFLPEMNIPTDNLYEAPNETFAPEGPTPFD